ncbi:hypothetical protein WA026_011626 [Henosepilachna vigintioctopunctata]
MFTTFFTNSKLYIEFQAHKKNTDIVQTPWTDDPNGKGKTRVVSLTAYTNQSFLPKTSKVTEHQTIHPWSRAGTLYSMSAETTMKGPPMCDSFYIEIHYCLNRVSDNESSIGVYVQIKYKKSVFGLMKGMIEKMTIAGLEEFWKDFCGALRTEKGERTPDTVKKITKKNSLPEIRTGGASFVPDFIEGPEKIDAPACTKTIILIYGAIFFLAILNVFLYNKLSSLENIHINHDLLKVELLKNAYTPSEEWLNNFQKQNSQQTNEMKKWQDSLQKTIHSLKEAENILSSLKEWTEGRIIKKIGGENAELFASSRRKPSQEL